MPTNQAAHFCTRPGRWKKCERTTSGRASQGATGKEGDWQDFAEKEDQPREKGMTTVGPAGDLAKKEFSWPSGEISLREEGHDVSPTHSFEACPCLRQPCCETPVSTQS